MSDEQVCAICGTPLVGEEWIDDDDCGTVHVRCLREIFPNAKDNKPERETESVTAP